jgi:hypothetical protein
MNADVAFLLKFLNAGIRVLSSRLLLIVTLLLTFSLFAWTMIQPDYWRLATASIFAIAVFLPIRATDSKGASNAENTNPSG